MLSSHASVGGKYHYNTIHILMMPLFRWDGGFFFKTIVVRKKIPTPMKSWYSERVIEFLSPFGRDLLKLILCCFCSIISPHTKFHPNRMKNMEVKNFHFWSILVGRAGRSKNGRSHLKHSISVWKVINDLCTKFKLNRMKIGRVSPFLNFWLVGWLGRSAWVKLAPELWFKADSHN